MVIGVGNDYRRDDGFGPLVVAGLAERQASDRRLAAVDLRVSDGEPTRLIDLWTGADVAVVVDAVLDDGHHSGLRYELVLDALNELPEESAASSHGISLGSTVALARALDRLPRSAGRARRLRIGVRLRRGADPAGRRRGNAGHRTSLRTRGLSRITPSGPRHDGGVRPDRPGRTSLDGARALTDAEENARR
nr:hypothetical protein GCM10020092_051600 [Actinoplanes digitatis]